MTVAPPLPSGTLVAGKFRIERLLGTGAMGTVYAVDHRLTHHKRALKLLHPALLHVPDLVRRFLNEASAAGRAGNPHLVETFDAGTLPTGEPYLVMELLEGEPLDAILKRERRLDVAFAAEIVAQAAEGIDAAHHAGIIHRDLKPANLFVTAPDGVPFVKILDFGVSKFAVTSTDTLRQTRAGAVYGSPAYMSPEQLSAADVDGRTDVFALGVVLFQSLSGSLPFEGPTLEALALRMLSQEPPPLHTLRPDVPQSLANVVSQALAPSRDDRFPTARALAEALSPFRARVPWTRTAPMVQAPTIASNSPAASSDPMVTPPSMPPGVAHTRRVVFTALAGIGAVSIALATALVVTRSRGATAPASPSHPSATSAADVASSARHEPAPAVTLAPASDTSELLCSPDWWDRSSRAHRSAAPRPLQPSSTPSTSGARHSAAQNVGLSEDNPFR